MSDQRVFAETLRMLDDVESLLRLIDAYKGNPSLSLGDYAEEENEEQIAA